MTVNATTKEMGHIPALDGIRAIAVMLVIISHANFQLGDNGILGVDIFFALSGYLITTLLLEENQKHNTISLKGFYIRRTMRLFPALYVMLLFVLVYALCFRYEPDKSSIISEVLSSALYLNNIAWVWGWGNEGLLLGHTWSLAAEEQFYLIWPWFLILALRFRALKTLVMALFIFVILIFGLKISGNLPGVAKSLVYESIFIGCFASVFHWTSKTQFKIPSIIILGLIGFMIIVGVLPFRWYLELYNAGGRSVMAAITAVTIIGLVDNSTGLAAKLLSNNLMVWVGKISYALYLWHVPIFRLFKYHSTLPPAVSFISKFVVTFILAIISWILIEKRATEFGRAISKKIVGKLH